MGAYLSEPVTEKESESGGNDRLKYGASSMQGWRVNQEDAHNCIVDFDADRERNCSFFAVYDGHGGAEVAKYTATKFPDYLRNLCEWKSGSINEAFLEAFLKFDETLRSDEVVEELKEISGRKNEKDELDETDDSEDKRALIEESCMPLEQILQKYGLTVRVEDGQEKLGLPKKKFLSPNLRPKKVTRRGTNGTTKLNLEDSADEAENASGAQIDVNDAKKVAKRNREAETEKSPKLNTKRFKEGEENNQDSDKTQNGYKDTFSVNEEGNVTSDEVIGFRRHCFSESQTSEKTKAMAAESRDRLSGGDRAESEMSADHRHFSDGSPGRNRSSKSESEAQNLSKLDQMQSINSEDMKELAEDLAAVENTRKSETPDTQTVVSSDGEQSVDDDDYQTNDEPEETSSDATTDDESSDGTEEDEVGGMEFDEDDDTEDMFPVPAGDTPGQDSGTTACVAVIVDDVLYVANVGDSRCVLARNGVAIELSQDHKPEDELEKTRIVKAGGCISADGRVNGGLNLSRALGDHFYKRNENIPLKDQMISSLPDITTETLTPLDRFMVLACDGIWNSMTSQEVVDFVEKQLDKNMELEKICEEICTHCLSSSTAGDGTGCDNMTVILTKFEPKSESEEKN